MNRVIIYGKLSNVITKVVINKSIETRFNKDIKKGIFNSEVRDLIEYWINEIEDFGYEEYLKSRLFRVLSDHELKGERQGQRSITLDDTGGRLIYAVIKNAIVIKVVKITSEHDYN